ncbi:MAG TPA: DSD1 family PLP-dependent enzyme [Thermomicrobiales bacterium]|nr:DSD1 family PLP-dependent enzyme [Thermomicrobiales bacterium]
MADTRYGNLVGLAAKTAVDTPALLVDVDALERNLRTMADFFRDKPTKLRPHAKTHKSPLIAHKQLALGAVGITCAKLGEAEVMVEAGIPDILIANQIVGPVKIARLMGLLHHARVTVAADDPANLRDLSAAAQAHGVELGVLVEVNTGMNRCGVEPGEPAVALAKVAADLPNIRFRGLQAYEGHLVSIGDEGERAAKVRAALEPVRDTRAALDAAGLPVELVSGGGTGTFALTGTLGWFDEIQAGSYVFMDNSYGQVGGVGGRFAQALTVLATVISRPAADRAVLDIGRKTLGTDHGEPRVKDLDGVRFLSYSEEHTKLAVEGPARDLRPGDVVEVVPGHVCTTVNLYDRYVATRGGVVEAVWPVAARGRAQ